jgi:TonB family protein
VVAEHFIAPARLDFTGWPGTFCRRPVDQPGVDTDCFGLSGSLEFNLDSLGRVTTQFATANTASTALNWALSQAVAAASASGDLPVPTKHMWSSKSPLTLTIGSSHAIRPKTVPFLRTMMLGYSIDVPPRMTKPGRAVYPEIALRMRAEDRVVLEYIVDTTGAAEPASIRLVDAHYTEFVEAALRTIRETSFAPALVHGCAMPVLVRQAVVFKN